MIVLGTYNFPPVCCNKQLSIDKIFDLILTKYLMDIDIKMPLVFHTPMNIVYEKYDDTSIKICYGYGYKKY
jgi:hypothetical protein